ncbi:MAG: SDR family NAD(P)-dependent oxidoreductase [Frankiaceae bacterium]|jgi:NAD(P)-dependent dehydrogenase (short-subunit alcohol dehydrogenase family)|nr:SDR family NAD(P)-dependent oxidoreductase [Frankiaceae bacterium]
MSDSLAGKVALVAGASRGIGADIARYLGKAGAGVAVAARTEVQSDPRLPGTIHSVAKDIADAGGSAFPVLMNLRDPDSIAAAVAAAVEHFGRLDFLINNAAIFVPGSLETVQARHIELSWQINLRGPILAMKEAVPHLRAAGGGHIINISSRGSTFPGPGPYAAAPRGGDIFYGAEKSMIEHFSQRQAMALQADGIAVNTLSPQGVIHTPGNLFAGNDKENPNLDFDSADFMGKAAVWMCQQPPAQFTGNIVYDEELCAEKGL